MKRAHMMPFGATVLSNGNVRFTLWAPAAHDVAVRLGSDAAGATLTMRGPADGWFSLTTDAARAGTRYAFVIDGGTAVPDPASRYQPDGVHGASEVVDAQAFVWNDAEWRGRPWEEAIIYELHVGTFTPAGTYAGVVEKLDYLVELGITAIELMPLSEAPGGRNWGYDGVQAYAPESAYGRPDELKNLIQCAHAKGLMVFLDVVYNHFGPEGNYLHLYAPQFFTDKHRTPWGAALNFSGPMSSTVRDYFTDNALYWIVEFGFDGLRLDAVDAIHDDGERHFLLDLAEAVRSRAGRDRHVHLVLENGENIANYLDRDAAGRPVWYNAQWNDDMHHVLHVQCTGETDGYYTDYRDRPAERLGRALAEGFVYQGEIARYFGGRARGQPSGYLPPTAFVSFLQNHDQIGNRAFGERIGDLAQAAALRAATAILLLAPSIPLLFMGEEWRSAQPFLFFCDFGSELADAVRDGRRREFARFPKFADETARARIPDPNSPITFARSVLDWQALDVEAHRTWLAHYRDLLVLRHREIVPRLFGLRGDNAEFESLDDNSVKVSWRLGDSSRLVLIARLSAGTGVAVSPIAGRLLYSTHEIDSAAALLPSDPWFVAWFLQAP